MTDSQLLIHRIYHMHVCEDGGAMYTIATGRSQGPTLSKTTSPAFRSWPNSYTSLFYVTIPPHEQKTDSPTINHVFSKLLIRNVHARRTCRTVGEWPHPISTGCIELQQPSALSVHVCMHQLFSIRKTAKGQARQA
jgi:hypothetical protein